MKVRLGGGGGSKRREGCWREWGVIGNAVPSLKVGAMSHLPPSRGQTAVDKEPLLKCCVLLGSDVPGISLTNCPSPVRNSIPIKKVNLNAWMGWSRRKRWKNTKQLRFLFLLSICYLVYLCEPTTCVTDHQHLHGFYNDCSHSNNCHGQ